MLYFIRHGQTDANMQRIYAGGEWDVPLNDTGRAQARDFAEANEELIKQLDCLYISPMVRAQETAKIITAAVPHIAYETIEDLREWRVGEWCGKSYDNVGDIDTTLETPPGGESFAELCSRVLKVLKNLAARKNERALVVAHGGVWRCYSHHIKTEHTHIDNCMHMELCRVTLQAMQVDNYY